MGELHWLIQRQVFQKGIDVIQLEYTALGHYVAAYQNIPCVLFEHDIYFQSVSSRASLHAKSAG